MSTDWTLETLKLAFQAITPLTVVALGWIVSRRLKEIEQAQWSNRKITEKRIEIYDKVSPLANRLFCYFSYVGDWQMYSPEAIIATKRELDHLIYVNRYLLEDETFRNYLNFSGILFKLFNGPGEPAKLKTQVWSNDGDRRCSPYFEWLDDFDSCFALGEVASKSEVFARYEAFMQSQRKGIRV